MPNGYAVVEVTGPPDRWVYINDGVEPAGKTNRHFAVRARKTTFELKASPKGPAVSRVVDVVAQDPPMKVDLTPT